MKKRFSLILLVLLGLGLNAQIIDPCFTSPNISTSFSSTANVYGNNSDCLEWTGATWNGDWAGANINLSPPGGAAGTRAIWQGDGSVWTTGGEGFGLRLASSITTGVTYTYTFTRVSHGTGSSGNFAPRFYTNNGGSFGYLIGNIPSAGSSWFTGPISFTATASQNGHTWIYFHSVSGGGSGMFLACEAVVLPMELGNLRGRMQGDDALVECEIRYDDDFGVHRLESSPDGEQFHDVAGQQIRRETGEDDFAFTDPAPHAGPDGLVYYRIRSLHADGGDAFSPVIHVDTRVSRNRIDRVYPNPVARAGLVHIDVVLEQSGDMTLTLRDVQGKTLYEAPQNLSAGHTALKLPADFAPGIYTLELSGAGVRSVQKVVIR